MTQAGQNTLHEILSQPDAWAQAVEAGQAKTADCIPSGIASRRPRLSSPVVVPPTT